MAFDKPTRNLLASFVSKSRNLIAEEFTQKFQSIYGIAPSGDTTSLDQLKHLDDNGLAVAQQLRERIEYLIASHPEGKDARKSAVTRLAREQAFTIVNRLAAIRMAEKRGLIVESVGKGYQSKGFKVFEQVAGTGLGEIYHRYRRYLFCLFDELAVDLGSLFDRSSPQALLFPREPALLELIALINAVDIDALWTEDETIGWIYQYYNDPAERKKMREESAAPRNSRELAVRNQFFTPRYVVEFLTDNTLGRIWYEMTKGVTGLKESCRYLVRRPTEIFLSSGETAPEQPKTDENLSQEELLKQPVYIPHRQIKDPRNIRMLDPACGSMHFGLYAFDLYERIYDEAWELEVRGGKDVLSREDGLKPLTESYADKDAFLKDVPRLIIEHNIHGIDIDPRAVQIAGLSLWLRAQKSWHAQGVKAIDRPQIKKTNIVCAEPMPGDKEMMKEFAAGLEVPALGFLVEQVFDKMQLAGEAGSLLKIEEEITEIVSEAKKKWQAVKDQGQIITLDLPGLKKKEDAEQIKLELDLSGVTNEKFWEGAEEKVYTALRDYAETVGGNARAGGGYQRRLFAEDAARGFAFIDVCRKRYEAVVMNPPFGDYCRNAFNYAKIAYSDSVIDMFAAFLKRGNVFTHGTGLLGAISSRVFISAKGFSAWRSNLLLTKSIHYLIDLGGDILDSAMVETACYIMGYSTPISLFANVNDNINKEESVRRFTEFPNANLWKTLKVEDIEKVPGKPFCYWIDPLVLALFASHISFEPNFGIAVQGLATSDDFRFMRLWYEVPDCKRGNYKKPGQTEEPKSIWIPVLMGGTSAPYYDDIALTVNWSDDGKEVKEFARMVAGSVSRNITNEMHYGKPGITFPLRTAVFTPRAFPAGCILTKGGQSIFPQSISTKITLGIMSSSLFRLIVSATVARIDLDTLFPVGLIKQMPFPSVIRGEETILKNVCIIQNAIMRNKRLDLACLLFTNRVLNQPNIVSLKNLDEYQELQNEINMLAISSYNIDANIVGQHEFDFSFGISKSILLETRDAEVAADIEYFIGLNFGRWDLRFATGARPAPELPDPFAPLPVCPPGMLQNDQGLPLTEEEFKKQYKVGSGQRAVEYNSAADKPADSLLPTAYYPLRISWPGILVDDESHPTEDIVHRIREAIEVIWKDKSASIEQEACEILGVKSLRDYFRKPTGFFADHLKRYSKSRRQAPIYWPLSTAKNSYTLWIYYHRLNDQTLHLAIADFIDPKLKSIRAEISMIRESGKQNSSRLEELLDLEKELADFHDEIERIIKLPWKPNLNDGVVITASPLWKLFRLPKWQKDLRACWEKLEAGDYDWAHLAYSIWPKRVEKVCETDRSIAIAHDLEHLCKVEAPKAKKARKAKGKKAEDDADAEVVEDTIEGEA